MGLRSRWAARKRRRRGDAASKGSLGPEPLREFVYLDAVSLHSLLVSQKSTIPENVSEAMTHAVESELESSIAADALVAKGDFSARYQTSNSNSVQTSRKAVVQTLFKEFRDLPLPFKLADSGEPSSPAESLDALVSLGTGGLALPASEVSRGDLIEIQVTLAVDPVFKLGTMMSEYTAMADEWPDMFSSQGVLGFLRESQPILRVLDRFLAGLIPIKATATAHVVMEVDGLEYVVHKSAIGAPGVPTHPLHIVGVTEHLSYWKDIRRVLFSDARFTMLCRIARDGVHRKWTPVKLADLFSDVAPGFVDQINAIQHPGTAEQPASTPLTQQQSAFGDALKKYGEWLVARGGSSTTPDADEELEAVISRLQSGDVSVTSQRAAFDVVRSHILGEPPIAGPSAQEDLDARQRAREDAGLGFFPAAVSLPAPASGVAQSPPDERMLDVEVIAIYW